MDDYNEWHRSRNCDDDISAPWHRFVKENLREDNLNNKIILEIGCGRGGFSNHLAHISHAPQKVIAADYSQAALDIARQKFTSTLIEWSQQDIMAIDYPENYFDTVISCETIEHVPDSRKAITELYRVLKPGGTLFLTCPNYFNLFGIWCLYRRIIGKPFTEGGQPFVNYILFPKVYYWLIAQGFSVSIFKSSEITLPLRVPKHFWTKETPYLLKPFGYRTYFVLKK
jgi:2-polyprenyl-3-methyl-5-hydroxy-6-metoxy-1,4-benzoquinol methylase